MITFDSIRREPEKYVGRAMGDAWCVHGACHGRDEQVDLAGDAYMAHVLRVAAAVAGDPVKVVLALLHDTAEARVDRGMDSDSSWWIGQVRERYGSDTALLLNALTPLRPESYAEYVGRVIAGGPVACAVKLADLCDNLVRLDTVDRVTARRLRAQYEPAVERIVAAGFVTNPPF